MPSMLRRFSVLGLAALLSACSSTGGALPTGALPKAGGESPPAVAPHDQVLAVAWMQQAAEYRAACLQAFGRAAAALELAKAQPTWNACLEIGKEPVQKDLPPAVVLDVDETVLDNSPYVVRRIAEGAGWDASTWAAWCKEQQAAAIPGALAYTTRATQLGIRVIYVTNRRSDATGEKASTEETDTRQNLLRLGFPIDERDGFDCVLTKDEHGDKSARRHFVAEHFRVLQLVGDNLGDFAPGVELAKQEPPQGRAAEAEFVDAARNRLVDDLAPWWGERWILIPNPSYGSFESVLKARAGSVREGLRSRAK